MKMSKLIVLFCLSCAVFTQVFAQNNAKAGIEIQHLEPAFWWVGMKNPELQLIVHGKDISKSQVAINYAGVRIKEKTVVENPNYLFLTLVIAADAKAGTFPIVFTNGTKSSTYTYELKNKSIAKNRIQGFSNADMMYLLMPDRFADGDETNNTIAGMPDKFDRSNGDARHGGDIKGITDHLDYFTELGATALWINPVLENNMPAYSYHGYAMTDLYAVDRRFGGNAAYIDLIEKAHAKGIKIIQDMVLNHLGNEHWFIKDLPMADWIHQHKNFTKSNFRLSTVSDPYVSKNDLMLMVDGWFDVHMADMNQQNRYLATYFIQNALWWIEYSGIDGIRMDTYPYSDKAFLAQWSKAILDEYPQFNIVGEVWIHNSSAIGAYWQKGVKNWDGYESTLPSITDFPIQDALTKALQEGTGWDSGLARIYYTLSEDFVYAKPFDNVIFLDNHDISRYFTATGEDIRKQKMGIALLATMRGVPQLYYGTELALSGNGNPHWTVRQDMLGGWKGDKQNYFTKEGRTAQQNEIFEYSKKIFNFRKEHSALHNGKLTHFVPDNDTYAYFRHNDKETIMVLSNNHGKEDREVDMKRFAEFTSKFSKATNVVTGEIITDLSKIKVSAMTTLVLQLQ
jgi:neopullulanase